MFRTLWPCRHAPVVGHPQTATVSSLVFSAVPNDAAIARPGSEYGDQLLDHHDLAGLRRRKHDELFHPDRGTLRAELSGWCCGVSVGVAFIRGLARQLSDTLGNFWVDLTRALLWILLPGALIGALLLVWQGVPMNVHRYAVVTTDSGHDNGGRR